MEALVLKGPRWCGRSTGQQLALAFRQTLARCRSAAVPGRAVLLLVLVHAHDRAELLVGRPIADDVVALGARPLAVRLAELGNACFRAELLLAGLRGQDVLQR